MVRRAALRIGLVAVRHMEKERRKVVVIVHHMSLVGAHIRPVEDTESEMEEHQNVAGAGRSPMVDILDSLMVVVNRVDNAVQVERERGI